LTNSPNPSPPNPIKTNPELNVDRAAGVLLGCAAGDALGAGYEFEATLPDTIGMIGGGLGDFEPGEWTDDTTMAISVAEAAAAGHDLRSPAGLDAIAFGFARWYASGPKDIGISTSSVLSSAGARTAAPTGRHLTEIALEHFTAGNQSAGNGALMRTAAVALAHLGDRDAAAKAAYAVSDLTHADPVSGEACLIWTLGIRHAVLNANFDGVRGALEFLPHDRAAYWATRLDEAEKHDPSHFSSNGWVVEALQAAWSAISRTAVPQFDPGTDSFPAQHLANATEAAVRAGHDTDTVAAIAGSLLGARWGASAVPLAWRRILHGWPGYRARDLVRLGVQAARLSLGLPAADGADWPSGRKVSYQGFSGTGTFAVHPHDSDVRLGGIDALRRLPDHTDAALNGVDAVVSLCRLGADEIPAAGIAPDNHVEVWLVDSNRDEANPHLAYVIDQAASVVSDLRAEGHTVLLHCVQAQSRTPSVAARYSARTRGLSPQQALDDICNALPDASPQTALRDAVLALGTSNT
jgi:ADP-ribosyl-[dinitrogen reductase] hydrolase